MKTRTDYQTIIHNGRPAFVLVPWEEFCLVRPYLEQQTVLRDTIPHAVVEANVLHGVPIVKAWREHLGLTQQQLAEKAGIKQPALARIESGAVTPRTATLAKLAVALGVKIDLLDDVA